VSAILVTKDAERYLPEVLAALACCDEILVVDSGSRDGTTRIAAAAGARVVHQDWLGYGPQKNHAAALARHDWVLSIDADEVLDALAVAALAAFDPTGLDPRTAFLFQRLNLVGTRPIRGGAWNPDRHIRLYHRGVHRFSDAPIHESVHAQGPVRAWPGLLIHHSYTDLAALFRADYHRLKAGVYRQRSRRAGGLLLAGRAVWGFLRSYLLKGGFRDGGAGVVVAVSVALNDCLGLALASEADAGHCTLPPVPARGEAARDA
jgi:glycosyltransferase involved in cell wall biosynthesis